MWAQYQDCRTAAALLTTRRCHNPAGRHVRHQLAAAAAASRLRRCSACAPCARVTSRSTAGWCGLRGRRRWGSLLMGGQMGGSKQGLAGKSPTHPTLLIPRPPHLPRVASRRRTRIDQQGEVPALPARYEGALLGVVHAHQRSIDPEAVAHLPEGAAHMLCGGEHRDARRGRQQGPTLVQ